MSFLSPFCSFYAKTEQGLGSLPGWLGATNPVTKQPSTVSIGETLSAFQTDRNKRSITLAQLTNKLIITGETVLVQASFFARNTMMAMASFAARKWRQFVR